MNQKKLIKKGCRWKKTVFNYKRGKKSNLGALGGNSSKGKSMRNRNRYGG
jgi:hypothetical protein